MILLIILNIRIYVKTSSKLILNIVIFLIVELIILLDRYVLMNVFSIYNNKNVV